MAYTPQTWIDNNLSYPLSASRMIVIENAIADAHQWLPLSTYGFHVSIANSDNLEGLRVTQNDTTNNPRAVTIVQNAADYALKIDQVSTFDTVNIAYSGGGAATALGIIADNTTLSCIKVTNTAIQSGGAIIAAVGNNAGRTVACFRAEGSGDTASSGGGFLFDGLGVGPSVVGLHLKAHASQNVDLVQIKNSAGTVQFVITNDFRLAIGATAPTGSLALDVPHAGGARISGAAGLAVNLMKNTSSFNNSRVQLTAAGTSLDRNIADANPCLIVQQLHASSTGDIIQIKNNSQTPLSVRQNAAILMPNLPSSDPTVAGQLWSNSGVVTVSAG